MRVVHIPCLAPYRALLDLPRGRARFDAYVRTIVDSEGRPTLVPLIVANPMAREHVAACLDAWEACGAEAVAAAAAREAAAQLGGGAADEEVRHGLALLDDPAGGWTNRWTHEADDRFGGEAKRAVAGWIVTALWASEPADPERLRRAVRATCFRAVWRREHGLPRTLGAMLAQEGAVGRFAGETPHLDPEELAYSREVIAPLRESDHWPTCVAAFFGDEAAAALGYRPLGLSVRAGLAVALADAARPTDPV